MDTPRIDALIDQCRRNLFNYPHSRKERRRVEEYIADLEGKRKHQKQSRILFFDGRAGIQKQSQFLFKDLV
jgi:hypothetical protein